MKKFWKGFLKEASKASFKKSVIVVFWSSEKNSPKPTISDIKFRYPEIRVKTVDISRDPSSIKKHSINNLPTVMLLKNGREIDRIEGVNKTLVEDLFRKAVT
jgi:thioredoxin-like negative regulator of GroEL